VTFSYETGIPDGVLRAPVVVYFAVTAGFVEEVAFRGLPLAALGPARHESAASAAYVLIGSMLFALIHWEGGAAEVAAGFVYALVAAALSLRLATLWPLVIAHVAVDLVEFW
jgi:membrane protease YdiL (CAAX protease family)